MWSRRLMSLRYRHLAVFDYEVRVLNGDAPVVIWSQVVNRKDAGAPDDRPGEFDPRVRKLAGRVLDNVVRTAHEQRLLLGYRAVNSGMTLGCGVDHVMETDCEYQVSSSVSDDVGKVAYIAEATNGSAIRLTKFASYRNSRSVPPPGAGGPCSTRGCTTIQSATGGVAGS